MPDYQQSKIEEIIKRINYNIFLPDIQRPYEWDKERIYKLFDSIMRRYPISTFLFWELNKSQIEELEKQNNMKLKMYKLIDNNEKDYELVNSKDRDQYQLILDGQQRLTSLYIALKGNWTEKEHRKIIKKELYFDILSGEDENEDGILFDFEFLDYNNGYAKIEKQDDGKITNIWINVKKIFEAQLMTSSEKRIFVEKYIIKTDSTIEQYKENIIDKINDCYTLIKDTPINYYPERENDYDKVLDIFVRVNSGGLRLGYSDLLFSKIKLNWDQAREEFKRCTEEINVKNFEFDNDFILKTCLLLFANNNDEVRYKINNFNETKIKSIINNWEQINNSIKLTVDLIICRFFITDKKLLPSYNALIPIIYWLYKNNKKEYNYDNDNDLKELQIIRVYLIKSLLSGVFGGQSDTILYKCKEILSKEQTIFPAEAIQKNIESLKNKKMELSEDKIDKIQYNSKESYLFLNLCYKGAINFQPLMKTNRNFPEQDHIFCKKELKEKNIAEEDINSIYNIGSSPN